MCLPVWRHRSRFRVIFVNSFLVEIDRRSAVVLVHAYADFICMHIVIVCIDVYDHKLCKFAPKNLNLSALHRYVNAAILVFAVRLCLVEMWIFFDAGSKHFCAFIPCTKLVSWTTLLNSASLCDRTWLWSPLFQTTQLSVIISVTTDNLLLLLPLDV